MVAGRQRCVKSQDVPDRCNGIKQPNPPGRNRIKKYFRGLIEIKMESLYHSNSTQVKMLFLFCVHKEKVPNENVIVVVVFVVVVMKVFLYSAL